MDIQKLRYLIGLKEDDYFYLTALEFESMISSKLTPHGFVRKQVKVPNRGDGRKGKIDIVFEYQGEEYAIEIDRESPRKKSIFKVENFNENCGFIILRSPLAFYSLSPTLVGIRPVQR